MNGPSAFDRERVLSKPVTFPLEWAKKKFDRLVGVENRAATLVSDLHLLFHPQLAKKWSKKHHKAELALLGYLDDVVPLFVFEGDVGTGKTALAETIGDQLSRCQDYGVSMVKISTQVRGTGYVGEMGTFLAESFQFTRDLWSQKSHPVILVIDEADSLLTTRDTTDQHHEDKSGVNTILQHLDELGRERDQIAVIAITNRVGVLDPAVRRRATAVETFARPTEDERQALFESMFDGLGLTRKKIDALVEASAPRRIGTEERAFTFSDLTTRLAVPLVRQCLREDRALGFEAIKKSLQELVPSPAMSNGEQG